MESDSRGYTTSVRRAKQQRRGRTVGAASGRPSAGDGTTRAAFVPPLIGAWWGPRLPWLPMKLRVDEAGDFNYESSARFWVGVVAGVVIPDQRWAAVEAFVAARTEAWCMPELKAAQMEDDQLMEIARFILAEGLTVAAIATDSRIFTADDQKRWRELQVELFRQAADRSERAQTDAAIAGRVERLHRRMHQVRHIRPANFLQYGILVPWLIAHLLSSALVAYRRLPPDEDSWIMDVVLDAKGGADPGKPGELLRDSIEHVLVGDERTALRMPAEWPADHPFKVRNTDWDKPVISARQVLVKGIHVLESHEDPGLQLADFVAHLVWTLIRHPENDGAVAAWRTLAPRISPTEDGHIIKVWAWPGDGLTEEDELRYARLIPRSTGASS